MKITQNDLKKIILEILEGNNEPAVQQQAVSKPQQQAEPKPQRQSAREKTVAKGLQTGGAMSPQEYGNNLKAVLFSRSATSMTRLKALEAIFPGKGATINNWIKEIAKQTQQGAKK